MASSPVPVIRLATADVWAALLYAFVLALPDFTLPEEIP